MGTASKIADQLYERELTGKASDAVLMRMLAEKEMNFVDYETTEYRNPLKSITHHQTTERDRLLKQQIRKLIRLGVPEKTQTSISELLKLPLDIYTVVVGEVEDLNIEEEQRVNELNEDIQNSIENLQEQKKKN